MKHDGELRSLSQTEYIMELRAERDQLKQQLAQAQAAQPEKELRQVKEDHDAEIGAFQDEVRDLVIKLSGAPDNAIDGAGSDAGWQEFTLSEISQGFAFLKDKHADEAKRLEADAAAYRKCLNESGWKPCGCPGHWKEHAVNCPIGATLSMNTAGRSLLERLEQVEKDYNELLFAVARKFEGETRHQTALRYINKAEQHTGPASEALKGNVES